jgi:hypothetical protein
MIGNTVIAENREDCSFIWENTFDAIENINEYVLSLFVKEGEHYRKYVEEHKQKGYTIKEIKDCLEEAGMEFLEAMDADTFAEPTKTSERIYCIAKEKAVKGKVREIFPEKIIE